MTESIVNSNHPCRQPWYQPADPAWADLEVVSELRRQLKSLDSKLNVWWIPNAKRGDPKQTGRWAAVYFMSSEKNRIWSNVFYWEDAGGGFRTLDMGVYEEFKNYLREHEIADPIAHNKSVEERKAKEDAEAQAQLYQAADECGGGALAMRGARRRVYSQHGKILTRKFINGDMSGEAGNAHARWLKSRVAVRR